MALKGGVLIRFIIINYYNNEITIWNYYVRNNA